MLQQSPRLVQKKLMMIRKHRMEEKFRDSGEWRRKVFLAVERKVCICVGRGLKFCVRYTEALVSQDRML